jgi:hypothetical protein
LFLYVTDIQGLKLGGQVWADEGLVGHHDKGEGVWAAVRFFGYHGGGGGWVCSDEGGLDGHHGGGGGGTRSLRCPYWSLS